MTDAFTTRLQDALGAAYQLQGELGGGGMSRVYLARETALNREVVLKVLPPELTSSVNIERFRREIQYAAQLQHPHIVPLLNAGENGDLLWYTMPRIPGESLRTLLERRGALPVPEVLQVLRDVADALGSAHQRGLGHRDIKPENILVQGEHALVTDFGVAKAISAALPGSGATAVGVAIGTPAYMAPEQVAGDPTADHRIDLYAVGLLAYELLAGETPFRGTSPHQTMAAHLIRQPTPPDAMRAGLPAGLSAMVMRCLQKDPADRYPDAAALLADLRRISEGSGGSITPPARPAAFGGGSRRFRDALMGAAVVAVMVAAGVYLGRTTRTSPAVPLPDSGGAPATLSAAPPPATPTLSLTDSLAIAEAVERRLAQQEAAAATVTRALLDSIRREITQAVTDSLSRNPGQAPASRTEVVADPRAAQRMDWIWRGAGAPGLPPAPPGSPAPPDSGPARVVMLTGDARLASSVLGPAHQAAMESVAVALRRAGQVQVIPGGRADSLVRRGATPETAARTTDANFYVNLVPVRRGDSVAFSVVVHDVRNRARPVRSTRTPFVPLDRAAEVLGGTMATQVSRALAELQRVEPLRTAPRPRNTPARPDSGGGPSLP